MNFNHTWKIGALINNYLKTKENLKPIIINGAKAYPNEKYLEEIYAKAIELTCCEQGKFIMPIDMAIEWIEENSIFKKYFHGYLLDKNGNRFGKMYRDIESLKIEKENGTCFVAWL